MPARVTREGAAFTLVALFCVSPASYLSECSGDDFEVIQRTEPAGDLYCGLDCAYVCFSTQEDFDVPFDKFFRESEVGPSGMQAGEIMNLGSRYGVKMDARTIDTAKLQTWKQPAILHVDDDHFVSYLGNENGAMLLFDNRIGLVRLSEHEFHDRYRWDGVALLVGDGLPVVIRYGSSALVTFWLTLFLGAAYMSMRR